jgi:hypothetical protein
MYRKFFKWRKGKGRFTICGFKQPIQPDWSAFPHPPDKSGQALRRRGSAVWDSKIIPYPYGQRMTCPYITANLSPQPSRYIGTGSLHEERGSAASAADTVLRNSKKFPFGTAPLPLWGGVGGEVLPPPHGAPLSFRRGAGGEDNPCIKQKKTRHFASFFLSFLADTSSVQGLTLHQRWG